MLPARRAGARLGVRRRRRSRARPPEPQPVPQVREGGRDALLGLVRSRRRRERSRAGAARGPGHAAAAPAAGGRRAGRHDAAARHRSGRSGTSRTSGTGSTPARATAPVRAASLPAARQGRQGRAVGQRARQGHDADRRAGALRRGEQPHPPARVPPRDGVRQPPLPAVPGQGGAQARLRQLPRAARLGARAPSVHARRRPQRQHRPPRRRHDREPAADGQGAQPARPQEPPQARPDEDLEHRVRLPDDPPDPFQTPIGKVPGFMGLSEWLSYRNPRVARTRSTCSTTSGTPRASRPASGSPAGKAKPGVYKAYRLPFFVRLRGARKIEVWGGVRAAGKRHRA